MDSAIAASIVRAQVKRASLAFTTFSLWDEGQALLGRQPGGLGEIPGFASPPRDGFALDNRSSGVDVAAHQGRYTSRPLSQMTNPYGVGSVHPSTGRGALPRSSDRVL